MHLVGMPMNFAALILLVVVVVAFAAGYGLRAYISRRRRRRVS